MLLCAQLVLLCFAIDLPRSSQDHDPTVSLPHTDAKSQFLSKNSILMKSTPTLNLNFRAQNGIIKKLDFLNKNWDFATVCTARTLLCYELTLSRQNNVHESLVQVRRSASVNRHSDHISLFFYLYSRQQLSFIYWSTFWLLQIHYNTWCLIKETLVILDKCMHPISRLRDSSHYNVNQVSRLRA